MKINIKNEYSILINKIFKKEFEIGTLQDKLQKVHNEYVIKGWNFELNDLENNIYDLFYELNFENCFENKNEITEGNELEIENIDELTNYFSYLLT